MLALLLLKSLNDTAGWDDEPGLYSRDSLTLQVQCFHGTMAGERTTICTLIASASAAKVLRWLLLCDLHTKIKHISSRQLTPSSRQQPVVGSAERPTAAHLSAADRPGWVVCQCCSRCCGCSCWPSWHCSMLPTGSLTNSRLPAGRSSLASTPRPRPAEYHRQPAACPIMSTMIQDICNSTSVSFRA